MRSPVVVWMWLLVMKRVFVRGDVDAGFVGEGVFFAFEEEFEGGSGAEDSLEAVIVDEEGFHFVFLLVYWELWEGIEKIGECGRKYEGQSELVSRRGDPPIYTFRLSITNFGTHVNHHRPKILSNPPRAMQLPSLFPARFALMSPQ